MTTLHILAVIAATLAVTAVALRVALRVVLRLPADYLAGAPPPPLFKLHGSLDRVARPCQRSLGVVLIGVGVLLSLPGVPGPGVAVILVGLMLAEVPGTHRFARRLLRRRRLRQTANRIRQRRGESPLA